AAIGQVDSGGYRAQALASAAISRDIGQGLFGFLEFFYRSREQRDEGQQFNINTGLVYRITPIFAVDAGVQVSLLGQAPDYVIRTGLSVLFGRCPRRSPRLFVNAHARFGPVVRQAAPVVGVGSRQD